MRMAIQSRLGTRSSAFISHGVTNSMRSLPPVVVDCEYNNLQTVSCSPDLLPFDGDYEVKRCADGCCTDWVQYKTIKVPCITLYCDPDTGWDGGWETRNNSGTGSVNHPFRCVLNAIERAQWFVNVFGGKVYVHIVVNGKLDCHLEDNIHADALLDLTNIIIDFTGCEITLTNYTYFSVNAKGGWILGLNLLIDCSLHCHDTVVIASSFGADCSSLTSTKFIQCGFMGNIYMDDDFLIDRTEFDPINCIGGIFKSSMTITPEDEFALDSWSGFIGAFIADCTITHPRRIVPLFMQNTKIIEDSYGIQKLNKNTIYNKNLEEYMCKCTIGSGVTGI